MHPVSGCRHCSQRIHHRRGFCVLTHTVRYRDEACPVPRTMAFPQFGNRFDKLYVIICCSTLVPYVLHRLLNNSIQSIEPWRIVNCSLLLAVALSATQPIHLPSQAKCKTSRPCKCSTEDWPTGSSYAHGSCAASVR